MLYICLVEPEIPQNTGNIARTVMALNATLVLIHPLGFKLDEKSVRRSGMDYWKDVRLIEYPSFVSFMEKMKNNTLFFFSSYGINTYTDINYWEKEDVYLVFGKESVGLGEDIIKKYYSSTVRIPMVENARCLNLSNSVAIASYEAMRQNNFKGLKGGRND